MEYRIEHDSLGQMQVPADKYWGAQTERSRMNFPIGRGTEQMPDEIIEAFAYIKKAAALVNRQLCPKKMTEEKAAAIAAACEEILSGSLSEHFPLVVFQTGSGTQTNMNANEVIANRGNAIAGAKLLHPNDDVNMSQSSNDTFPTALHVSAVLTVRRRLLPALDGLIGSLYELERKNADVIKIGRTHLQDATPIRFAQEVSGWRNSLETDREMIIAALPFAGRLAIGGTAVGTGLNAPAGFDAAMAAELTDMTGEMFETAENKYHALTSHGEIVQLHGAMKALAADMMKIANDIRFLGSGPRCGLGELELPANEPGSSIMPGKINPTQCEAVTMVAVQVMGNDAAIGFAASQGNFELNVFLPVIAYNFLQSARLLADVMGSFAERCIKGLKVNEAVMERNVSRSLMLVTALSPVIGYEKAAETAQLAHKEGSSLKEACLKLGYLSEEELDRLIRPEKMV